MTSGKKLGRRIKQFRLDKQLTQKQVAQFFGVSIPTITRLEAGKNCTDLMRAKLEKLLDQHTQVAA